MYVYIDDIICIYSNICNNLMIFVLIGLDLVGFFFEDIKILVCLDFSDVIFVDVIYIDGWKYFGKYMFVFLD